jgi:hypothetical protein
LQAAFIAIPLSVPVTGAHDERVGSVFHDTLPSVQQHLARLSLRGGNDVGAALLGTPIDIPSASAVPCPASEVVFARGTNEHRELHRLRETRACPVAKRHIAKPIAAGHSTGNPAPRTDY